MGKGTDKLYITHSEWASSDSFSANSGARTRPGEGRFRKLPFNFCAASLQPFKHPVCTPDGTIFDAEVIASWLETRKTNPVNGEPLQAKDLIKLNFARNADGEGNSSGGEDKGDLIDPVSYKVFTDNTHIVAIRHGEYANVFSWDTVERMNIKAKMWRDLVDDAEFTRKDIITLQDPQNAAGRDMSSFKYLQDGEEALRTKEQEEERKAGNVNIEALGRIGEKVLRAREAVEKARREREAGGDVNRPNKALALASRSSAPSPSPAATALARQRMMLQEKKPAFNAAAYTTGKAAASFTSTGLTPETSGERALLSNEEWMLKPKRVKNQGYARIETNHGDITIELHTDTAPKAVWNFVRLAQKGYYRGVTFHRNIRNFMLQGGDPTGTGKGGTSIWGKNFEDEFDGPRTHSARGIVSMANKGKNTNSSQFFITYRPAKHLDRVHTIFGRVVEGLDVLDKLEAVPTDGSDRPLNKIVMKEVVVFVDPFEEFLKEKNLRDEAEAHKAEVRAKGGTEDDRVTWTGKRIRGDDAGGGSGKASASDVGKYLKMPTAQDQGQGQSQSQGQGGEAGDQELDDTWDEPVRKKVKGGGFGNFDDW